MSNPTLVRTPATVDFDLMTEAEREEGSETGESYCDDAFFLRQVGEREKIFLGQNCLKKHLVKKNTARSE